MNPASHNSSEKSFLQSPFTAMALLLAVLVSFAGCSNNSSTGSEGKKATSAGITLPQGFTAEKVAENLGRGRHITVRDNGDIYMRLRELKNGKGMVAMRDTDGDNKMDRVEYFTETTGTGVQVHNGYLYYTSTTEVKRVPLPEGDQLVPDGPTETIASGFPEQNQHAAKPITFDGDGNIYVTVGAPSNSCQKQDRTKGSPGMDPCPLLEKHGGIWKFDANTTGQDHMEDGERYATGIRHTVSLAWKFDVNKLYTVQHGRDQLNTLYPDYYDAESNAKLPSEEFLKVDKGDNFGWPYSYYDHLQGKRVLAPEYGGDGEKVGRAADFEEPIMAFPGHWAPNGLTFYTADQFPAQYQGGAFIAWHGSWNRAPKEQAGYKVSFVPFDGGEMPSGDYQTFADGFAGVDPINSPGDAEYRPMGLSVGPSGALYISDSIKGTVWRVTYSGS